jgi:toxin FitB
MILLDTNVVSELCKAKTGKANSQVLAWAKSYDVSDFYLSAISVFELELDVALMERKDANQGLLLRHWLDKNVMPSFENRILNIDVAIAKRCASLYIPDPRADRDALIAATALVHSLTLATRNTSDFRNMGLRLVNPWG